MSTVLSTKYLKSITHWKALMNIHDNFSNFIRNKRLRWLFRFVEKHQKRNTIQMQ